MKPSEQQLRDEIAKHQPFTVVTASGDRVKIRSHDHIDLPPLEDENGLPLDDNQRADFFKVWTDGRHHRWVAFDSINIIEAQAPTSR
jgi:hypothetical protein